MKLTSVDSPKPERSILEGIEATAAPPREVIAGNRGKDDERPSRAAEQFIVRGKHPTPLRQPHSMLESLLTDTDRRKQILETEKAPWRMICSMEIVSQNNLRFVGTGWFVAPRTLITAGHCVFDKRELGGWARTINIFPGRNGDRPVPLETTSSSSFSTTDRWLETQDPDYDYAAIHLDSDLGSQIGTFGIAVLPDDELTDRLVNVSGYPLQPGFGKEQYFHANRVKALTARRLFYDVDTMGGQSGSPVWAYEDGSEDPIVIGIHAYGVGGTPADLNLNANSGPRILPEVLDVIKGWIAQGNPA